MRVQAKTCHTCHHSRPLSSAEQKVRPRLNPPQKPSLNTLTADKRSDRSGSVPGAAGTSVLPVWWTRSLASRQPQHDLQVVSGLS